MCFLAFAKTPLKVHQARRCRKAQGEQSDTHSIFLKHAHTDAGWRTREKCPHVHLTTLDKVYLQYTPHVNYLQHDWILLHVQPKCLSKGQLTFVTDSYSLYPRTKQQWPPMYTLHGEFSNSTRVDTRWHTLTQTHPLGRLLSSFIWYQRDLSKRLTWQLISRVAHGNDCCHKSLPSLLWASE